MNIWVFLLVFVIWDFGLIVLWFFILGFIEVLGDELKIDLFLFIIGIWSWLLVLFLYIYEIDGILFVLLFW